MEASVLKMGLPSPASASLDSKGNIARSTRDHVSLTIPVKMAPSVRQKPIHINVFANLDSKENIAKMSAHKLAKVIQFTSFCFLTHVEQLGGKMLMLSEHEKHTSSQSSRMKFLP